MLEFITSSIKFENNNVLGSISLEGAVIDDLRFKKYKTEPTEIAIYAFDLTYYFLTNVYRFDDLPAGHKGLSCGFNFIQESPNVFKNDFFHLLRYNNYQLESLY